jgi:cytochrome c-type biogenesis protein CcsB
MMKKILLSYFSMISTGILMTIFAIAIGYATFIENDYGAITARILIYNTWWFELLLFLLALNLIGSVVIHKLINRKKWAILLFHIGFLLILIGAAATRYTGFEGTMHIREGEQSNKLTTSSTYLKVEASFDGKLYSVNEEMYLSPIIKPKFNSSFQIADKAVKLRNLQFIPSATETVISSKGGIPMLNMMVLDRFGGRNDFVLKQHEEKAFGPMNFCFYRTDKPFAFSIWEENERLFFHYTDSVEVTSMGQATTTKLPPGEVHPLFERTIYSIGHFSFVLKEFTPLGKLRLISVPAHTGPLNKNAISLNVSINNEEYELFTYLSEENIGEGRMTLIEGIQFSMHVGRTEKELPFSVFLKEFQLERYPGSNSPSSFASEVILLDREHNVEKNYRIYMNNILKYRGYRFFQSSYDQDEMGSILSVNFDALGTSITYIGYFIMTIGMVFTLFVRGSRFRKLAAASSKLRQKREKIFTTLIFLSFLLSTHSSLAQNQYVVVSNEHAREFGKLQVQNIEGRIEPVNTLASKVLRKLTGTNTLNGLNPVQFLLEVSLEPEMWLNKPVIKITNSDLTRLLGVKNDLITFHEFFSPDQQAGYKLESLVNEAYNKRPSERSRFEKDLMAADEKVNIFYMLLNGNFLTIFPLPGSADNKWVDLTGALLQSDPELAEFASQTMMDYKTALKKAKTSGDYTQAFLILSELKENQKKQGIAVYPSDLKTNLEVFYINVDLYSKLNIAYLLAGFALLILQLTILLRPSFKGKSLSKAGFWLVMALFSIHTAALIVRWFISGHAPWSNGYETLLYISWSACLAGLVFSHRSPMALAITTLLASITLFVAGMSWMNPELTNLAPVLKSYWLIIHVAIITASYGFFGMGALLGFANLLLMILRSARNQEQIDFTIRELGYIIQLSLIIGLFLLTIGSFLGGVWANESWGRYWGWDPKETWALITILVYAFITHMHKIKGFTSYFALSTMSFLGFSSVLMTFFGVNYYLSGLHSYVQGDPPPVPNWIYFAIAFAFIIISFSYFAQRKQDQFIDSSELSDISD